MEKQIIKLVTVQTKTVTVEMAILSYDAIEVNDNFLYKVFENIMTLFYLERGITLQLCLYLLF